MSGGEVVPRAYLLRRMTRSDLPEVLIIERQCFSKPWHPTTFEGELQNEGISFPLVAVEARTREVAGYIIVWKIGDEGQINNLAVHPGHRRRGVAELMLRDALESLREEAVGLVTLEVRKSNAAARTLYEKLGFTPLGVRKEYYSNPVEDALVLSLTLN